MRFRQFCVLLCLGALLALPVMVYAADTAAGTQAQNQAQSQVWNIRPAFDPNGVFGFCLMDRSESDGRKVTVALSQRNEFNLGFMIPSAGLKIGELYDIIVTFSNGWTRTVRGEVLNTDTLLLRFGAETETPDALAASTQLTLTAATGKSRKIVFAMPAMASSLASLRSCLAHNKDKVDKNAASALLPPALQQLLALAGLTRAVPLSLDNLPAAQRPADYMWKIGDVVGGARQREVPGTAPLDELVRTHLEALREKCGSSFTSQISKVESYPAISVETADAECNRPDQPVFIAALYYLAPNRQLSIMTHESPMAARSGASQARDALLRVVRSLASQSATENPQGVKNR